MTEFHAELTARAHETAQLLRAAQRSGDDYTVDAHRAELDNIVRIAQEHGVDLPGLDPERSDADEDAPAA